MARISKSQKQANAMRISQWLASEYPDCQCALIHDTPLQLLVATILSAQCTDERVNMVTPQLFAAFPSAKALGDADINQLEQLIASTGFFRNKAKNIKACCRILTDEFHGETPRNLEQLVQLPGVGRKTANVLLGTAFGIPSGVVVDTHVARLSRRLGLAISTSPEKIESELMEVLPRETWIMFSHRLIWHGRRVCQARKPRCDACGLADLCPRIGVAQPARPAPAGESRAIIAAEARPAPVVKASPASSNEARLAAAGEKRTARPVKRTEAPPKNKREQA